MSTLASFWYDMMGLWWFSSFLRYIFNQNNCNNKTRQNDNITWNLGPGRVRNGTMMGHFFVEWEFAVSLFLLHFVTCFLKRHRFLETLMVVHIILTFQTTFQSLFFNYFLRPVHSERQLLGVQRGATLSPSNTRGPDISRGLSVEPRRCHEPTPF